VIEKSLPQRRDVALEEPLTLTFEIPFFFWAAFDPDT